MTGSTTEWTKHFLKDPAAQRRALDAVFDVSTRIDAKHGTNIVHHIQQAIRTKKITFYP
jgi:hypothetical protein